MVTAECHAHIFMDGVDYKKAAAAHENGPREDLIREHLAAYQKAGISYVRDGGDPYGAGVLARSLAPEYGITYRTPVFAIHRAGRYGKIVGRAFSDWKEYCALVRDFFRRKTTEQYPENRATLKISDRFRGELVMIHNDKNEHRCVACGICQMNCPNGTINVVTKQVTDSAGGRAVL